MRSLRLLHAFIAPLVFLALPAHVFAQSVVADDAYVTNAPRGLAKQNFGKAADLRVSGNDTTYTKFQLSNIPGSAIERATLRLFVSRVSSTGRLDVFAVRDTWDEGTITGDTAPPPATLIMTTDPIDPGAQSHFLTLDVTSLVRLWAGDDGTGRNGLANNGIAIVAHADASGTPDVAFDSKENSDTSHEPQLIIQVATTGGVRSVGADAPIFVADGTTTPHITLGTVPVSKGGTGLASAGAAGSFLRSTGTDWTSAPLAASDLPAGSGAYIQNGTALQPSNFNVGGVGAASVLAAGTQFNLSGERVLANPGNSNLYVGRNTGTVSAGAANTFVGNNAGSLNTTAIRNTFVGADAGRNTTSGGQNTFVGTDAGKFNTDGFDNTFFGDSAGGLNVTGCCNAFYGTFAGANSTTGSRNLFVGVQAGNSNTTASSNTFVGTESGKLNTTGAFNSYFGDLAGVVSTTGSGNTLLGFRTGEHVDTGSDNSFIGIRAGDLTTTGSRNVFVGRDTAFQNVSGDDNTFVGSFAEFTAPNTTGAGITLLGAGAVASPDITNSAAIGFRAQVTTNNTIVLGGVEGVNGAPFDASVAIGTTAPLEKLDVRGGNILIESPGRGLILRSPAGTVCRRLSIDNEGTLLLIPVQCPGR